MFLRVTVRAASDRPLRATWAKEAAPMRLAASMRSGRFSPLNETSYCFEYEHQILFIFFPNLFRMHEKVCHWLPPLYILGKYEITSNPNFFFTTSHVVIVVLRIAQLMLLLLFLFSFSVFFLINDAIPIFSIDMSVVKEGQF